MSNSLVVPCILVVEEQPLLQQLLQTMIHILGAKCICTSQPNDALALFQPGVDMVILSLGLPQTSSFELARQMRANESAGTRTPIIGHATVADPEEVQPLCISADMDELIPKMTSVEEVYQLLSKWLNRPFVMPVHLFDVHVPATT